jgi:RimJ/RimL family protein N-acetyltransferase
LIGQYLLSPPDGDNDVPTWGWWLSEEARGKGYGTESLAAVIAYSHEHLHHRTVMMGTSVENTPALRQIAATGAVLAREGPHHLPNGQIVDSRWFVHTAPIGGRQQIGRPS